MDDVTPIAERPPRRFRRLRIAASVFFIALTVALCVLWARSFLVRDAFFLQHNQRLTSFGFNRGGVMLVRGGTFGVNDAGWTYQHDEPSKEMPTYQWHSNGGHTSIIVPVWAFAAMAACGIFAPFSYRFSLRALLIATTLVAVVLGLIAYTDR